MIFSAWGGLLKKGLTHSIPRAAKPWRRRFQPSFANTALTLETRILPAAVAVEGQIHVASPAGDDINTIQGGTQSVAVGADGRFVMTWEHYSTDGNDILARLFDADGTPAGDAFLVNTTTANGQYQPSVAMSPSGSFVVVWETVSDDGLRYDIFAQRYGADGTAQETEFRINADVDARRQYADIAMDADGDFVVTWRKFTADFTESEVYFRRFDSAGTPLGDEVQVGDEHSFLMSPDVAMASDGSFAIAWLEPTSIRVQQFDAEGNELADPMTVNENTMADMPTIALDESGGFVVTWYGSVDGDPSGDLNIYARRYLANGIPAGDQFVVHETNVHRQWYPTVAMSADGNFVISWTTENPDFSNRDVIARTFNSDGLPLGAEFRVNPVVDGDQRYGHVAMTTTGEFVVNWADVYNGQLYARRFVLNLTPTDLTVSATAVAENSAVGTVVGTLSGIDADGDETFVFELVSGDGDGDNADFEIVGDELRTVAVFDYETRASYTVRIRATDPAGAFVEKILTVHVTNAAEPSVVTLTNHTVNENLPKNTLVGLLGLTDAPDGAVKYRLIGGAGGNGNSKFRISGNQLLTNARFNFEKQSSYSVRVQATDAAGNVTTQVFTISITDVDEAPTAIALSNLTVPGGKRGAIVGQLTATDPSPGERFRFTLVPGAANNNLFTIRGTSLRSNTRFDPAGPATYTVRIRVTDRDGLSFERDFTISVV